MRIGPLDPTTHKPQVGVKNEVVRPDHTMGSLQPRMMKVFKLSCNFKGKKWFFWRFQNT